MHWCSDELAMLLNMSFMVSIVSRIEIGNGSG